MEKEIEKLYSMIDAVVASNKTARNSGNYLKLLENGQQCLNAINELIKYSVDQESSYRKFEAKRIAELAGEKGKNGVAETEAKATDYYREWQRAKQTIELLYELANMAKKLTSDIDKNIKAI